MESFDCAQDRLRGIREKRLQGKNSWISLRCIQATTKSDHKRLAQQECHPERSEGSRSQTCPEPSRRILRCAQNDNAEGSHSKVC
jgi:hypothetical protein